MIYEKLKQIICDEFLYSDVEVNENTSFDELGFDDLDMVDLAMDIEDEFEVEVTDEQLENFRTIADVVKFLEK